MITLRTFHWKGKSKRTRGQTGRFPRLVEGSAVSALHNPRWCEDYAGGLIGVGSFAARLKPCPPHDVVLACDIVPGHVEAELADRTCSFDRYGRRRRLG